jgi:hypothetical protein
MFGNTKVIKNDVKWICKTLKDNEKWKGKIEENVGKCPAEERIGGLEEYDKKQNTKIDKVSDKVSNLTGKISVWGYILTGIIVICTILTIVLGVFDRNKVRGEMLQVYNGAPQYCNCGRVGRCSCDEKLCDCVECRTAIIEEED